MVFAIECIAACVLFTLALEAVSAGRREVFLNDYPPVVTDKLRELHLVAEKPPAKKSDILRKGIAMIVYALLFALSCIGSTASRPSGRRPGPRMGCGSWWTGTIFWSWTSSWHWFDKFYKLAKVSPVEKSAVWFHFKASVRGMVLGLVVAPVVGLLVTLL